MNRHLVSRLTLVGAILSTFFVFATAFANTVKPWTPDIDFVISAPLLWMCYLMIRDPKPPRPPSNIPPNAP